MTPVNASQAAALSRQAPKPQDSAATRLKPLAGQRQATARACRYGPHPVTTLSGHHIESGLVCEACSQARALAAKTPEEHPPSTRERVVAAMEAGATTVQRIAAVTGLARGTVTDVVTRLSQRGMAERTGTRGRAGVWRLTGQGGA